MVLFFVGLFSCKKIGNGILQGTVYETGTELPIQGTTIILKSWRDKCSSCPYMYDSVHTDSEGKFKLYFKSKINWRYELYYRDDTHFGGGGSAVSQKKENHILHLDPLAYLKIRLEKTGNSGSVVDQINNRYVGFHHSWSPADTILQEVFLIKANVTTSYSYTILYSPSLPNGVFHKTFSKDIFVKKGDTLLETITYE